MIWRHVANASEQQPRLRRRNTNSHSREGADHRLVLKPDFPAFIDTLQRMHSARRLDTQAFRQRPHHRGHPRRTDIPGHDLPPALRATDLRARRPTRSITKARDFIDEATKLGRAGRQILRPVIEALQSHTRDGQATADNAFLFENFNEETGPPQIASAGQARKPCSNNGDHHSHEMNPAQPALPTIGRTRIIVAKILPPPRRCRGDTWRSVAETFTSDLPTIS